VHSREISQRTGLKALHNGNVMARTFSSTATATMNPEFRIECPNMQALVVALALLSNNWHIVDTSWNARIQLHKGDDRVMPFNPSGFTELDQSLLYLRSNLLNALPKQGHAFGRSTKNTAASPTLPCAFRICGCLHAVDNVKFTGVATS